MELSSESSPVVGRWVRLEEITSPLEPDVYRLDRSRELVSELGGPFRRAIPQRTFAPPMYITSLGGERVGVVANSEDFEYPGVAIVTLYTEGRARPGLAVESAILYVDMIFSNSARVVRFDVAEFNRHALLLLCRLPTIKRATRIQHLYAAGRFWDSTTFSFTNEDWHKWKPLVRSIYRLRGAAGARGSRYFG